MTTHVRNILCLAAALALLWGCTRVDAEVAAPVKIAFSGPAVRGATKAVTGEMGTGYDKNENFTVYALSHVDKTFAELTDAEKSAANFMDAVDCGYSSALNGWDPAAGAAHTEYFWMPAGTRKYYLTFQAFSPTDAAGDMTVEHSWKSGFSFSGFTVASEGSQYDLLYTKRHMDKQRPLYSATGDDGRYDELTGDLGSFTGVDLEFFHALCAVEFLVRNAQGTGEDAQKVSVTGIRILNAYETGNFEQRLLDDASNDSEAGYPRWAGQSSETDYKAFDSSVAGAVELTGEYTPVQTSPMILMPQDIKHASNSVKIEITYTRTSGKTTVTTTETVDLYNDGSYYEGERADSSKELVETWKPGYKYTYKISIGLHKVFLDPDVSDWKDKGGTTIQI